MKRTQKEKKTVNKVKTKRKHQSARARKAKVMKVGKDCGATPPPPLSQ